MRGTGCRVRGLGPDHSHRVLKGLVAAPACALHLQAKSLEGQPRREGGHALSPDTVLDTPETVLDTQYMVLNTPDMVLRHTCHGVGHTTHSVHDPLPLPREEALRL